MTVYKRTNELPPHEEKFKDFYLRYSLVDGGDDTFFNVSISVEVWKVLRWDSDDNPVFCSKKPLVKEDHHLDPSCNQPLMEVTCKWGGCIDLRLPYFHFHDMEDFDKVRECIDYIVETLAVENGVCE